MRFLVATFLFWGGLNSIYFSGDNSSAGIINHDTIGKLPADTIFIKAVALDSFGKYCDRFPWDVICAEKIRFRIIDPMKSSFPNNEEISVMVRNIDLHDLKIVPNTKYQLGISKKIDGTILIKEDTAAIFWTRTINPSP
ncbi:hypothetical protein QEG73_08670 [Chitinophagaceae bacterium 26-R-25]|nr:hypothetical protein [Chitinophagaceae bacterium 26-R-25]